MPPGKRKQRKQRDLDALLDATRTVLAMKDFQSCAREIFDSCCRVTGATSGYVALLSESGEENEVLFLESGGRPCSVNPELPMPIRGLRAEAYLSGSSVYDNDFPASPWVHYMPEGHVRLDNVLFSPLNIDGKTVGIMGIANKSGPFNEHDARMATAFGEFAAIALRNSKHLDELTRSFENQIHLEKQLQHADKMQAIGTLSASIAHEFNNPLTGITHVLHGIKRRAAYDEQDGTLLDMAISECSRIRDLIRTLQDFNRPSSGRFAPLDIHQAIDSLLLLYTHLFNSKQITIRKKYAPKLPQIIAVADQIKQVLLNIVNNALDASREHGEIAIETAAGAGTVSISISDNGTGIEPHLIDKLFTPFFTTKPEVKGTGLGLSVSYGIVNRHEGEIMVESEPGIGSTFTIILPTGGPRA